MNLDSDAFRDLSRFLAPSAGGGLADRALAERMITLEQHQACVDAQRAGGRPMDDLLVDLGHLKPEEVDRLRAPAVPVEVVPWLSNPDRVLDPYVLVSLLGQGGMAEVWKAWDRSLGRWVAIKYLKQEIPHPTQRIEREGRLAGQLSHPSIISIYERGLHNGRPYLVMPFVDGAPPKAPLPPREVARLGLEVARALAHAHERGVIHRDVKPSNLLIGEGGRVLLADFGIAVLGEAGPSRWSLSGTPEYASPEQLRGDPLDARSDIYSLGATLYHLLKGSPPYPGETPEEISRKIEAGQPPPLEAPRALAAAVLKSMAPDPARRFPTMEAFAADLERWIESARPGLRVRPLWIAVALLATALPWISTYLILSGAQQREQRSLVLETLRNGDRRLALAERLRRDPEARPAELAATAREALTEFRLALRLGGQEDPEIRREIGRCHELLDEPLMAEQAYEAAGARAEFVRIRVRRLLEGRRDRDWRSILLRDLPAGDPIRHLLENRPAELLALDGREWDDELMPLIQGKAALDLGRWAEAQTRLEAALRPNPRDPLGLYFLGLAKAGAGDDAGARQAWQAALRNAPGDWPRLPDLKRLAGGS